MSFAPAASSETACWRIVAFTSVTGDSAPGFMVIAAWQSAAPLASSPRAFPYSICIAATGICGPASAVDTLWVSWMQADLISHVLPVAPGLQGVPEQARHGGQVVAPGAGLPGDDAALHAGRRLSAPPLSAAWAAEGTLPFALLLLFGGWLTWLPLALPAAAGAPPVAADVPPDSGLKTATADGHSDTGKRDQGHHDPEPGPLAARQGESAGRPPPGPCATHEPPVAAYYYPLRPDPAGLDWSSRPSPKCSKIRRPGTRFGLPACTRDLSSRRQVTFRPGCRRRWHRCPTRGIRG